MVETFKNLEKEILEHCYSTILSLKDYYHDFTIEKLKKENRFNEINEIEILYSINQLEKANYIEIIRLPRMFRFRISLYGIIFLERFYLKEQQIFIPFIVDVLDFLKKVEDGTIKMYPGEGEQVGSFPILKFLEIVGRSKEERKKLGFIIHKFSRFREGDNFIYFQSIGFGGNRLLFFRKLLLTSKGRKFLRYYQKLRNLFQTIHDDFAKEIILEEYNEIEHLRKRGNWKDVVIKMGIILEYLITNYIEENCLNKDNKGKVKKVEILIGGKKREINPSEAKFGEKLSFIIQNEIFGRDNNYNWKIVDGLIKDLRNYIHLQKYIKERTRVDKDMFNILHPVFEKLILLF